MSDVAHYRAMGCRVMYFVIKGDSNKIVSGYLFLLCKLVRVNVIKKDGKVGSVDH